MIGADQDYVLALQQQPGMVSTVDYDPTTGRVLASGAMSEREVAPTRQFSSRNFLLGVGKTETHYVEFVGDARAPVLRPRPALGRGFDKTEIAVREPATISDLAPASVSFDGPVKGRHEHPGGDLVVGWTVPGSYTVTVEAWPALPAIFALTVGDAA